VKRSPVAVRVWLCIVFTVLLAEHPLSSQEILEPPGEPEFLTRVIVPGAAGWVDTGRDVEEDADIVFSATGRISLQVGNPVAVCGPDGYEMRSVQQPLPDENIGALIGKVVQLVGIKKDEETGEETREEIVRYFMIGASARVRMPLAGRLHLGINENVFEDNAGAFTVDLARPRRDRPETSP
jgi:hypothetical protein